MECLYLSRCIEFIKYFKNKHKLAHLWSHSESQFFIKIKRFSFTITLISSDLLRTMNYLIYGMKQHCVYINTQISSEMYWGGTEKNTESSVLGWILSSQHLTYAKCDRKFSISPCIVTDRTQVSTYGRSLKTWLTIHRTESSDPQLTSEHEVLHVSIDAKCQADFKWSFAVFKLFKIREYVKIQVLVDY